MRNMAAGTRLHDVSFELCAGEVLGIAAPVVMALLVEMKTPGTAVLPMC